MKYVKYQQQKILIVNKYYGLSRFYNPGKLSKEVIENFNSLKSAALKENINLFIVSGFRSFAYQKELYDNYVLKYGEKKANAFSAKPGHSEHQTGLAIDLINTDSNKNKYYQKEYEWLSLNASKFGFILRYPKGKEEITGYIYEPWHFRYVGKDLAKELYNNANWITLEEYFKLKNSSKFFYSFCSFFIV